MYQESETKINFLFDQNEDKPIKEIWKEKEFDADNVTQNEGQFQNLRRQNATYEGASFLKCLFKSGSWRPATIPGPLR